MTARKKPESNSGNLLETTNDWLRDFLKHLELFMVETVRSLSSMGQFRVEPRCRAGYQTVASGHRAKYREAVTENSRW